ncbi:hypothetical protein HQ520_01275, partial [bacterium]|nr:hypothetical protein [bacterium]
IYTASESAPLTMLSIYRLTGDKDFYHRRTVPTMAFALSRSNAHFSPDPTQSGRYADGSMEGPVSLFGSSTYGGLWEASHRLTPRFGEIAFPNGGVRVTSGYTHCQLFEEYLVRYLLLDDYDAFMTARGQAGNYRNSAVWTAPTQDLGTSPFWMIQFVPDWDGLLRMYEEVGAHEYLDAAAFGARQLMTGMWTQPVVPESDVTIHPGGVFDGDHVSHVAPKGTEYFRLGHPRTPGDVTEKQVPAWTVSNVGMGFEQPVTYRRGTEGGGIIYQAGWAPDFLRLARYTGEKAFETYARNSTIGRWGNYPGYYLVGMTDLPFSADYPFVGPDVTAIYYHHIVPHLTWTLDYLMADAELLSDGEVEFPFLRQTGYAYFNNRTYGHAPGKIYDYDDVWLWLKRGLVTLDNSQMNYLTGHTGDKFFLVLMNQSHQEETVAATFSEAILHYNASQVTQVQIIRADGSLETAPLASGVASVTLPARDLAVLALDGTNIQIPTHHKMRPAVPGPYPSWQILANGPEAEVRAAAIQVEPGPWDAYIWSTAWYDEAATVTLHYELNGALHQEIDNSYPFEFTIPVADTFAPLPFYMVRQTSGGGTYTSGLGTIGAMTIVRETSALPEWLRLAE